MHEEKKDIGEKELESIAEEAAKHGATFASLHFDAHGKDEEAVKNALVDLAARLAKENGVLYCKGTVEETIRLEDGTCSSCMEVKVLVENFSDLLAIALRYGPIAAEVLKPPKISLELGEAQTLLLEASRTAQDYARYVLEKILSPEEKTKFQERMKSRVEFGKKLEESRAKRF